MKKIVAMFFVFAVTASINISVARADIIKISDVDAQTFIHSVAEIIYDEQFQKELPLLMTNAVKIENVEMPEIGKAAWACQYGLKTAPKPEGEILFFVDDTETVSALKIISYTYDSAQNATILLMTTLKALGLTQADAEFLLTNLSGEDFLASSIVWSDLKKCCFVLMAGGNPQGGDGFQFVLMASDKKE